jgi:exopolysaccharide biosynthesis polyprenyl glycosylphosphotransferase
MSYLQKHPKYKWALALGDSVALSIALSISVVIVEYLPDSLSAPQIPTILPGLLLYLSHIFFNILFFHFLGLYHVQVANNWKESLRQLCKGYVLAIPPWLVCAATFKVIVQPHIIAIAVCLSLVVLIVVRYTVIQIIQHSSVLCDKVVIIGGGAKGQALLDSLTSGLNVKKAIGYLDDNLPVGHTVHGVPVLGKILDASTITRSYRVDFFIMAIENINRDYFFDILKFFNENNLTIYVSSHYLSVLEKNLKPDKFNTFDLIRIGQPLQSQLLRITKRLFDLMASTIIIGVFSPFLVLISITVKFTSKGPVIYKQTRIGKGGKPFTFYKFRSMLLNSDNDEARTSRMTDFIHGSSRITGSGDTKIVNRSRITPIGRILRKTSLDELPQLFNVLRGEMSLVGPRPCLPDEWRVYGSWQKQRLKFMPGCTGFWQVSGRSKVSFEDTVIMDLYYNCNVSLWLDLKILINTIPVMLFSKGGE